jgi:Fur family ferric uptake transcriptional regulator
MSASKPRMPRAPRVPIASIPARGPRRRLEAPAAATPRAQAEAAIRATGERVTQARVQVLDALQRASRALTHHEVEEATASAGPLDRVTVYRVLDWLTRMGLAHRIAGEDRVWRFNTVAPSGSHEHAHFRCNDCSRVICLDEAPVGVRPRLPAGYRSQGVEVTVIGQCPDCRRPIRQEA